MEVIHHSPIQAYQKVKVIEKEEIERMAGELSTVKKSSLTKSQEKGESRYDEPEDEYN